MLVKKQLKKTTPKKNKLNISGLEEKIVTEFNQELKELNIDSKEFFKRIWICYKSNLKISEGSPADKLVEEIVLEMMKKNDSAKDKFDKTYITPRSVCTWLKEDQNRKRKTFNQNTLKRYFAFHKDEIDLHNKKHDLNAEHNKLKYHYLEKEKKVTKPIELENKDA